MPVSTVSNAEFDRFIDYMNGQFLGGPGLAYYLLEDLGKVDGQGRPEQGCTLWWFVAHLDPGSTKVSSNREELRKALKRGSVGRDEVQRIAFALIGDARASLGERIDLSRIDEFDGRDAAAKYVRQRATLMTMLDAAEEGVRRWHDDPSYEGDQYFFARNGSREYTSDKSVLEGPFARKYSTDEDANVQGISIAQRERMFPVAAPGEPAPLEPSEPVATTPTPAATSPITDLTQGDAVDALLAADVLEYSAGATTSAAFIHDAEVAAVDEVVAAFGLNDRQKKLLGQGTEELGKAYVGPSKQAKEHAQAVLKGLGVTLRDVRLFRKQVPAGAGATSTTATSTPASTGAAGAGGKVAYPAKQAELSRLADAIVRQRSVSTQQIAELKKLVDSLDLATIEDVDPNLQELFQMKIFTIYTQIFPQGGGPPDFKALCDIYYGALNGHKAALQARAASGGFISHGEAREQLVAIMKATTFASPPDEGVYAQVEGIAKKIDPKMRAQDKDDLVVVIFTIAAYISDTESALWKRFHTLGDAIKK